MNYYSGILLGFGIGDSLGAPYNDKNSQVIHQEIKRKRGVVNVTSIHTSDLTRGLIRSADRFIRMYREGSFYTETEPFSPIVIGMIYYQRHQLPQLIAACSSIEDQIIAAITAMAIRHEAPLLWGKGVLELLKHHPGKSCSAGDFKRNLWESYINLSPQHKTIYTPKALDVFYRHFDTPLIAYHSVLTAKSYSELCDSGIFHSGKSVETGSLAVAWWVAYNGISKVPPNNYLLLDQKEPLENLGETLHSISRG